LDGKIIKREQVFIGTWNGGPAILAASFELVGYEIDASQWQPLSDELAVYTYHRISTQPPPLTDAQPIPIRL
jgi:hypothetical protein